MIRIYAKLKCLKGTLRLLSKEEYGQLDNIVKTTEDNILEAHYRYQIL